jgi:hypothetical protein
MKSYLCGVLLTLGMLGTVRADNACIGFTGQKCDRSYPANEWGVRCALWDSRNQDGANIAFGGTTQIDISGNVLCDEREARFYLKDGRFWLPWTRYRWGLLIYNGEKMEAVR